VQGFSALLRNTFYSGPELACGLSEANMTAIKMFSKTEWKFMEQ
jgi:hypothetical protein